jgi:hypothetical protein
VVRAPFDAVVRERLASVGDLAVAGTPLLRLAERAAPEIRAAVPVAQLQGLRAAGAWTLQAGEVRAALAIARVSPLVDAAGQTREVIFSSREPLPPGLAGEVRWVSPVAHLPADFVQQRGGRQGAYRVQDGKPLFVALPDAQVGRAVAVDWPPDAQVVDEGRHALGLPAADAESAPEPAR